MIAGGSVGKASSCCLIAWAIAGTNARGFKSRSSQSTSANCSGVIRLSEKKGAMLSYKQ